MRKTRITVFFMVFSVIWAAVSGMPALNSVFSDHMVIQRDVPLKVYGVAKPWSKVKIEIAGQLVETKSNWKGKFAATVNPLKAGGPFELKVSDKEGEIVIKDVLAGDVWFCSGQSNMEWPFWNTEDGAKEFKSFKELKNVRIFQQEQLPAPKPMTAAAGSWAECTKDNVKDFSAVAYLFGKNLEKEINVPVGLINSSWGGTPIEIWMDEKLLSKDKMTKPIMDRWKKDNKVNWKRFNRGRGMNFEFEIADIRFESDKKGVKPLYIKTKPKEGENVTWEQWAKPGSEATFTEGEKSGVLKGIIGFSAWGGAGSIITKDKNTDLSDHDRLVFRARGVGEYSIALCQDSIKDYDYYISETIRPGKMFKEYVVPIKKMKQGGWGRAVKFTQDKIRKFQINVHAQGVEMPSALYNGMVKPYENFRIKGVVWYQGENNAWRAKQYRTLLPMWINNWRKTWRDDNLPFLIVQLPNFMERKEEPAGSEWAELREAQLEALKLNNTAVVSTIDIGDPKDIHPRKKGTVAKRLVAAALGTVYKKGSVPMGPIYDSMEVKDGSIMIKFKYTGKGLKAKGKKLTGFSIAGRDKEFAWADAKIVNDMVVVKSSKVKEPVAVRYAWADNPECSLYNAEGLVASPFRTDDWEGLTDNNL